MVVWCFLLFSLWFAFASEFCFSVDECRQSEPKINLQPKINQAILMNERNGRFSRISPSPNKGATAAYTLCPMNDPDSLTASSVLSIPLSAITLSTKNTQKEATGLYNSQFQLYLALKHLCSIWLKAPSRIWMINNLSKPVWIETQQHLEFGQIRTD